jgi:NADH dehydrogenase
MSGTRSAVTGAFSYTGRYLTRRLLDSPGSHVVNFTNHPGRTSGFTAAEASRITTLPLDFTDEAALARGLEGCDVLYCTYWIRFARGEDTHERAAERLSRFFSIAKTVGVRKVVFSSHTRTSEQSPFAYIAGKARAEATLRQAGLAYAIVRPCGIFGDSPAESILMNNAAYVMRRTPLFLLAGNGESRFQPVHVRDMAELMQSLGTSAELAEERDACGPDAPTARELFSTIARACGSRALVVAPGISSRVVTMLTKPLDMMTGDVLLDTDDLDLMLTGLTVANDPADPAIARRQSLYAWLEAVGPELGKSYISSIERYYK